ncbi:MAG: Ig-like domain-containing protein [Candidatus Binatia bacterium]
MILRASRPVCSTIALLMIGFVAGGCGGNNGSPAPPTNTPAPAATATPTRQAGNVAGLLVLNRSVSAGTGDALGAPPQQWMESKDSGSFDRSLAAANWSIDGGAVGQGVSGPDGRFTTGGLSPGSHMLQVTKTLGGNLASVSVPFTVGDDGGADLVVEMVWGQVKSSVTYTHNGALVRVVQAPNGSWLTTRDSRITSFGDGTRSFVDPTGSGTFAVTPCVYNGVDLPPAAPYPCNADGTCSQAGDRCVCVPSCPACDDCSKSVCVPSCPPVDITGIAVSGPSQLIVGQQGSMSAMAQLSDGSSVDVTSLVDWQSSDTTIAAVDSWGTVSAIKIGSASITATLGTLTSTAWPIQVTARPPLQKIDVQNVSCMFPKSAFGGSGGPLPPTAVPAPRSDVLPVPNCSQVVQVGATIQFRAIGEFDNGYYQDITDEVQWQVAPPEVGSVVTGLFTAQQAGTAALTATLDGVASDGTTIRVVTQPTVIALSIYADNGGFVVLQNGSAPPPVASGMPCLMAGPGMVGIGVPCCCPGPLAGNSAAPCQCNYAITVLRGDQLKFHATAQYDTGAWQDVTNQVTWSSSDTSVATIDVSGVMTAVVGGDASIEAAFESVTSDPASVHVVNQATLQSLYIYQEGTDHVVAKGDQRFFHASGYYDVGISRDVTTEAVWHSSDDAVGGFDSPGVFTGRAAGTVQVWAELDGQKSGPASLEVFETSELTYCDPTNINRAVWSDDFNRVTLESDCAFYNEPGLATLRYSVTEIQPHGGIFNPCLDLYVFAGKTTVRTIREQGCGAPFLAGAPAADALKYQLRAFWDLKDDNGNPVPPGTYTIYGRFYLYYDPVVSLDITVLAPGQPTPTPAPTLPVTPTAVCTPPACPAGTALVCPQGGAITGNPPGDLGCCPDGWDLYPCTFAGGGKGLACHNPALGCPSSEVCGQGCDPVVTGTCDGCSDGCGYICVSETPLPTPATTPVPTVPLCCEPGAGGPCPVSIICPTATPGSTPPAGALVSADAVSGQPGTSVTFNVTLHSGGAPVAGVQDDINFDAGNAPIAARSDGNPDCTGLLANKVAAFSFIECAGGNCPGVRAIVYSPTNTAVIPDGSTLYSCRVAIAASAAPGIYPLTLSNLVASDPLGHRLPLSGISGQVAVLGSGTPTPTPEGDCFVGPPKCAGSGFPTSQQLCCNLSRYGMMPGVVSWCFAADIDSTGGCSACSDPCVGLPPPSTATPVPTIPLCCEPGVGIPCPMGVMCPPPTPGGCGLACDGSPCLGTCSDGSVAKGTCTALTIDRGCECAPDCAPVTPGPPTPTPAAWIKVVTATGQPGEAVTFAVSLTAAGQRVARVENYLRFDPNIGIGAKADGTPDCTVNPDIHKNATAFSFVTVGDETWMHARVYDDGNSDPIPDGAILYTCTVNIAPTAPPATYPMIIWKATGTTPEGATLDILGQEGAIVVTGTPQPTCTPPPCGSGEVFDCPGPCLGNCGMSCGTPTATPPPTPTLAPITLVAGSTSGQPGEMVSFTVSMSANGEKVWGVGNDLTFDPLTAIAATADGEPDCTANPQTHKTGMFNFQPVGCSAGQCSGVRALVLSIMSLAPIPGDMVLYTCNVRITGDAPAGSYPLVFTRTDASTTDARTLPVNSTDGEIVVLAPDQTHPPTPTPLR